MYVARHLYLHGSAHLVHAQLQRQLHKLREREHALLQHSVHGYNLASSLVNSGTYHLVVRVEG